MGNRIDAAMKNAGLNQTELSTLMGVTPQAVQKWVKSEAGGPKGSRLSKLSAILGVSVDWLLTGSGDYIDSTAKRIDQPGLANTEPGPDITGRVPLISWVQAGQWSEIIDNHHPGDAEEWRLTTAKVSKNAFALRVVGDSMINPHGYPSLPPGVIVIVEPNRSAKNGDIVIARLEDSMEATIKKLVIDGHQKFLKPLNPHYPVIEINGNCTICGVAIKVEMDL